jgi:hypothetical protein
MLNLFFGAVVLDQSNHHMVAHMRGSWRPCLITGTLDKRGGYNVFQWQSEGQKVPALLFESDDLPAGWKALDEFEGDDYCRITIPVEVDGRYTVANVYVDASSARTGSLMRS